MRASFLILAFWVAAAGCGQNDAGKSVSADEARANAAADLNGYGDSTKLTSIQWEETTKNFGKINEGQRLQVSFKFRNTGDKPLVISMIRPSCGCTVVEQPEKPVPPGETGEIKGEFNSEGKPGMQHKSITVSANTKGAQQHNLIFEVEVVKKPE